MEKKFYVKPSVNVEFIKVEKGFATSGSDLEQGTEQMDEVYFEDGWE